VDRGRVVGDSEDVKLVNQTLPARSNAFNGELHNFASGGVSIN